MRPLTRAAWLLWIALVVVLAVWGVQAIADTNRWDWALVLTFVYLFFGGMVVWGARRDELVNRGRAEERELAGRERDRMLAAINQERDQERLALLRAWYSDYVAARREHLEDD